MKNYILYDSSNITFGKGKTMQTVKRSVVAVSCGEGGMNSWGRKILGK